MKFKLSVSVIVLGLMTLAAAVAGLMVFRHQDATLKRQDGELQRLNAALESLETRCHKLEAQAAQTRNLARSLELLKHTRSLPEPSSALEAASAANLDEERTESDATPPNSGKDATEQAQARAEGLLSKYDQAISNEPANTSWSIDTLRQAKDVIRAELPGARIVEEKCGGNNCKIVIEHAAGDSETPQSREFQYRAPFDKGCTLAHTPATATSPAKSRLYLHNLTQPLAAGG